MENPSQTHTSRSIFKNVLYGLSTWIFPVGLTFISTPIILKSLGNEDYGIYALVLGLISYSFNLSFGRAITKYIAEYKAVGESAKVRDVISATLFINVIVGFIVVVMFFVSANYLVADVFHIKAEDQRTTIFAVYCASLTIFFLLLSQVFNSILQGIHRFDLYSKIANFNSSALIIGNIVLAYKGFGLLTLFSWNLLVTFIGMLLFLINAKRCLPEFGISFRVSRDTIGAVLKFSAGVIGHQILANLFVLLERGWITRKLGAENLTFYVVPMSLSVYIHSFISSIVLVVFPLASEFKNQPTKLLRLYSNATKVVCILVVFIGFTIIIHSQDFLTLWLGADFAANAYQLLIIHTITFSLLAILTISWNLTEGLGYPQFNTLLYAICIVSNMLLIFFLIEKFNNLGVAIARLVSFSIMFFSLFYVERWFFGKIQIGFWLKLIFWLGAAAIISAIAQKLITQNLTLNWFSFLTSIICGGIIYLLTIFFSGFITEDEKNLVRNMVKR